jgi:hypothetical protein
MVFGVRGNGKCIRAAFICIPDNCYLETCGSVLGKIGSRLLVTAMAYAFTVVYVTIERSCSEF